MRSLAAILASCSLLFAAVDAVPSAFRSAGKPARGAMAAHADMLAQPKHLAAPPNLASIVSVLDFGAVGDNRTDNTSPFQQAINAVAAQGGVVYVPAGLFAFTGSLNVPRGVSLVGTYQSVPSHDFKNQDLANDGSILLPTGGRGTIDPSAAFITLNEDCTLKGVTIYYPQQIDTQPPVPYPWTVMMTGDNAAVIDVELLNPWNGINATRAARHYISRVQGQPINIGIFVDQTYDIGRVENVHWNPWWTTAAPVINYTTVFGRGFVFARTDWEYVLNTFVFAMAVGYDFVESSTGSCNGNFVGIGADCCANASVRVQAADPWGVLITNGEFTSFSGSFGPDIADHNQVLVTAGNKGAVSFVNSAFWGPSNQIASISGSGSVSFDSCIFNAWDGVKQNRSAIHVYGGDLQVRGSNFQFPAPPQGARNHVQLEAGAGKAIITENLVKGPLVVVDGGAKKTVIANNADDGW